MARSFNGTSDTVIKASSSVTTVPLTISMMVKPSDLSVDRYAVTLGNSTVQGGFFIRIRSVGTVRAGQIENGGTLASATSTQTAPVGTWTHVGGVYYDDSNRAVFVNGGDKVLLTQPLVGTTLNRMVIGARYDGGTPSEWFAGDLAECAIWDIDLSDAEMALLGKGVSPLLIRPQNLVSYVPLIGKSSPEIDFLGTTFTVSGTTASTTHPRILNSQGQPYIFDLPSAVNETLSTDYVNVTFSTTSTRTQLGKANIYAPSIQTITGKANIYGTTSRTQTGKAHIGTTVTTTKTQNGTARIVKSNPYISIGTTNLQTMIGWSATAQAGHDNNALTDLYQYPSATWANYDDEIIDAMLDVGLNRLRLEMNFADVHNGGSYEVNTTSDAVQPSTATAGQWHFNRISNAMDTFGTKLRNRLAIRGQSLYVTLCFVDFNTNGYRLEDTASEFAFFVNKAIDWFYTTYGFLPNSMEVLEPDNSTGNPNWTAAKLANGIVSANTLLVTNGYGGIKWAVPTSTVAYTTTTWIADMKTAQSTVMTLVDEYNYHLYGGDNTDVANIKTVALADGKTTFMSESHQGFSGMNANHIRLYDDLTIGYGSSWEQYTIAFPYVGATDDGGQYFLVNTSTWAVTLGERTKYLKHYFKYVRRGAVMKSVTNSSSNYQGLPFANANGKYVIPIKCTTSGTIDVIGLPAGTYGIRYTLGDGTSAPSAFDQVISNQTIATGEPVTFTMSGAGIVTIFELGFAPNAQVQTGKAAIRVTTTKTQTGVAKIAGSTVKTQTGKAAIQKTVSQTQSGKAAIQKTTVQTQVGTGRIQKSVTQVQSGKAAIQKTTVQTQTGVAKITDSTVQTQTGKAAIQKTASQTQSGTGRIQKSATQNQVGTGRVQKSVTQTQIGKSAIQKTTVQTQTGKAAIQKITSQTQTGVAKITASTVKTQTGKAAIQKTVSQTQSGKAAIQKTTVQTQTGKAAIQKITSQTQVGTGRIQKSVTQVQSGKAAVRNTITQPQSGISRITTATQVTQTGKGRIQNVVSVTQTGRGRIQKTVSVTQTGKGRIQNVVSVTQTGRSLITASTVVTQSGKAAIQKTISQTQTGVAKITDSTVQTQTGKAAIQKTASQTQSGTGRIQKSVIRTQTGKANIIKQFYASPSGNPSGDGSFANPWDLQTGLNQSGWSTGYYLNLRGGTYYGKFTSSLGGGTVRSYIGEWAVIDGNLVTSLTNSISNSVTTFDVTSTSGVFVGNVFTINDEDIQVSSIVDSNTITGIRGWNGTSATAHTAGTLVYVKAASILEIISSSNTVYRDFQITSSSLFRDETKNWATSARGGGLSVIGSANNNSFVGLIINDTSNGAFIGSNTSNTLITECLIYQNGVILSTGIEAGMGIYAENASGYSRVYNNVVINNWNFNGQFYGVSGPYVGGDHQKNIWSNGGWVRGGLYRNFNIIIGPNSVSSPTASVTDSHFYQPHDAEGGAAANMGYGAGITDLTFNNNFIIGGPSGLMIGDVTTISGSGNQFYLNSTNFGSVEIFYDPATAPTGTFNNNTYHKATGRDYFGAAGVGYFQFAAWKTLTGFDASSTQTNVAIPDTAVVMPTTHKVGSAHIVVYSPSGANTVNIDLTGCGLIDGAPFHLRNAYNYFGSQVYKGTFNVASPVITVPLVGAAKQVYRPIGWNERPLTTLPDMGIFVLVPESGITYTTQYQDGRSRIRVTTTKTQTGVAKIAGSTVKTQTGKAAIQKTVSQTQSGKAAIQKTTVQTQTGVAKITDSTVQTQTGKSAIQKTASQTQSGTAKIGLITIRTQTGKAAIQKITIQTQTGVAKITASTVKTQVGKASIQKTSIQTQTGKAAIYKTAVQTQTGKSAIQKTTIQTQTGIVRITSVTSRSQSGKSAIQKTASQTQTGVAKITDSIIVTQSGKASIRNTVTHIQLGVSRIGNVTTKTLTGTARIQRSVTVIQTGQSRIQTAVPKLQIGVSKITAQTQRTQFGKSALQKTSTQTHNGVSTITSFANKNITGTSRVGKTVIYTQVGVSRVLMSVLTTQLGVSRITTGSTKAQIGVSRITRTGSSAITGTSRITKITTQTQPATARIQKSVTQITTGKAFVVFGTQKYTFGVARISPPYKYAIKRNSKSCSIKQNSKSVTIRRSTGTI